MSAWKHWSLEPTGSGTTVWIDVSDQSQNTFSADVLRELAEVLQELEEHPELRFVLFRSRKPSSFFAGADIHEFTSIQTTEQAIQVARTGQELFARLEALRPPTVAVIQGACLGGGLEMALACSHRVAVDVPATRLGLPETTLGILPGWGGTQRLTALIGAMNALGLILPGRKLAAAAALKMGLVDRVLAEDKQAAELQEIADELTEQGTLTPRNSGPRATWLGWFLNKTRWGKSLVIGATQKNIARDARHYPALKKVVEAVRLAGIDPKKGYAYEQEALAELMFTPTSRNLVRLFLLQEQARNPTTWDVPEELKSARAKQVAVLGGGTMGAGIVQLLVKSKFAVVLKEINEEALNAARERIDQAYGELVARRRMTNSQAETLKQAIQFTTEWDQVHSSDIVIEAVPETLELKQTVFRELSDRCPAESILASNTSALSISQIAEVVQQPARVAGLHFFNPVHRMDLVEVVRAKESSPETLGKLLMLCRHVGKTPILVNDSPGFVVNRVLMPYLDEAVRLAVERTARGQDLTVIDREMRSFGMPMGPLELLDQVGLDVAAHVAGSMTIVFGENSFTATVLQRMLDEGRLGRKTSNGFYSYSNGKKRDLLDLKPLLTGLDIDLPEEPETPLTEALTAMQQRLILAMVNEAGRCLDEQVVTEDWMIDLAMVLGTGFAPFEGGPLTLARKLPHEALLMTLEKLEAAYGPRYQAAEWLKTRLHEST